MKIYKLNPDKSNIIWSGKIGDQHVSGKVNVHDGTIISEMGEVIEGNIAVDLKTLSITDTALSKEQRELLENAIKSSSIMEEEEAVANFKFEEVISSEDHELIKGILMVGNQAFGLDLNSKFDRSGNNLVAKGETQVEQSNPVLIEEIERRYIDKMESEKTCTSFDVTCELFASTS